MRAILDVALKDLRQLMRDKFGLFWIFGFPLLNGLFFGVIFSGAGDRGVGALTVAIIDEDQSDASKAFSAELAKSKALTIKNHARNEAESLVRQGELTAFIALKKGYGKTAGFFGGGSDNQATIEVGIDPARQAEAGYLQGLLMEATFKSMQSRWSDPAAMEKQTDDMLAEIDQADDLNAAEKLTFRQFFSSMSSFMSLVNTLDDGDAAAANGGGDGGADWSPARIEIQNVARDESGRPRTSYEITFPSSIMWGIIGCAMTFAISIVTERVHGTYLRLCIAPLSPMQILAGKGLACFLTSTTVVVVMLAIGRVALGVRLDNPLGLVLAAGSTAFCFVGITMLMSTIGKTENSVAGAGWGVMMPLMMLGGGMIPLIAMPSWMIPISHVSPVKWGVLSLEGAIWRGFSLAEMALPCGILLGVGAVTFAIGVRLLARSKT